MGIQNYAVINKNSLLKKSNDISVSVHFSHSFVGNSNKTNIQPSDRNFQNITAVKAIKVTIFIIFILECTAMAIDLYTY